MQLLQETGTFCECLFQGKGKTNQVPMMKVSLLTLSWGGILCTLAGGW